jgi:hypothetical protein
MNTRDPKSIGYGENSNPSIYFGESILIIDADFVVGDNLMNG